MKQTWGRFYEWLFRYWLYPLYEDYLRGRKTLEYVRTLCQRDEWLRERLQQYQIESARALLRHAADQVPWYTEQIRHSGLVPEEIDSLDQLSLLPVLTKQIVRDHYDDLIARDYRGRTFSKVTGGSTGVPFRFEITREDYERRMAVMWRGYARAGARMGRRTLYLWGADIIASSRLKTWKNQLYHGFFQRRMLNSFRLTRENRQAYYRTIKHYQPEVIVAYVSPLYELARAMLENGWPAPPVQAILTGAEPLHDFQRDCIESAFACPVYNTYGCREVMLIASEAPGNEGLLINSDQLHLETVDEQGQALAGGSGDLLLTDLHARGMPLIRYANGDRATLAQDEPVNASLPWPRLASVQGRKLDMIRTPSGALLPGEFFPHLLKDIAGIEQFQVIQRQHDRLLIRIVPDGAFGAARMNQLRQLVTPYLGDGMALDIEPVNTIPLTRSGKLRVTVCELEDTPCE